MLRCVDLEVVTDVREVYNSSETSITIYLLTQRNNPIDLNIEELVVWMGQERGQIQWWASN